MNINELENIEQLIELASKENDLAVIKDCENKMPHTKRRYLRDELLSGVFCKRNKPKPCSCFSEIKQKYNYSIFLFFKVKSYIRNVR